MNLKKKSNYSNLFGCFGLQVQKDKQLLDEIILKKCIKKYLLTCAAIMDACRFGR